MNGSAQFLNGTRFDGNFTANMRVRFICNDGYMLHPLTSHSGTTNRCRPNGTWKKTPSTCIPGDYMTSWIQIGLKFSVKNWKSRPSATNCKHIQRNCNSVYPCIAGTMLPSSHANKLTGVCLVTNLDGVGMPGPRPLPSGVGMSRG